MPSMRLQSIRLSDGAVRAVTSGEASYVDPDIARNGTIAAARMQRQTDIWKFPIDGAAVENVRRAVAITRQTGHVLTPSAGPGDREVVFLSDSGGHANLWVVNTASGELRQITHERDARVASRKSAGSTVSAIHPPSNIS